MMSKVMKEYGTEKLIIMTKLHSRNEYTVFKSSSFSRSATRSINNNNIRPRDSDKTIITATTTNNKNESNASKKFLKK